jgi:mannose-6-phosphate isomerase-like protein (cupin superfamily)
VLQKLDLATLAEGIELPYRPLPLVSLGSVEASLFVCDDKRGWHRNESHDQLMLVLEGVITLDGMGGKAIVGEGELASIPSRVGHNVTAGMRSTVVLFREQPVTGQANGHVSPPDAPRGEMDKVNVAADVHAHQRFDWQAVGAAGGYATFATRLLGSSDPYQVPAGSLVLLVYRGVLDYRADEEEGSVVGSQMLIVPSATRITLSSERGATVLVLVRSGMPLPRPAASSPAAQSSSAGGEPGP